MKKNVNVLEVLPKSFLDNVPTHVASLNDGAWMQGYIDGATESEKIKKHFSGGFSIDRFYDLSEIQEDVPFMYSIGVRNLIGFGSDCCSNMVAFRMKRDANGNDVVRDIVVWCHETRKKFVVCETYEQFLDILEVMDEDTYHGTGEDDEEEEEEEDHSEE